MIPRLGQRSQPVAPSAALRSAKDRAIKHAPRAACIRSECQAPCLTNLVIWANTTFSE